MIFLAITLFGSVLIAALLFGIWAAIKYQSQSADENGVRKFGGIKSFYVFAVTFVAAALAVGCCSLAIRSIKNYSKLPRYEAKVIGQHAYYSRDSDGHTSLMYETTVEFKDVHGHYITIPTDLNSGEQKKIGSTLKVGYEDGMSKAEEYSVGKLILMIGLAIMTLALTYFILFVFTYLSGRNTAKITSIGINILLYALLPLILLGFGGGLGYGLYRHFTGERPAPGFAVGIMIFFEIFIAAFFFFLMKWLFIRRRENKQEF